MEKKYKHHLFIVEDNLLFNMALKADIETTFAKLSVKVHAFGNGEECMKEFRKIQPQVVITDYRLNSKRNDAVDGIKVLDWVKSENPQTSVIVLTSEDDVEIALKSFHHGAADYVVKTETKFNKINYSLFNLFRMIDSRNEAKRYKNLSIGLIISISVMIGVIATIQILEPEIFK